MKGMQGVTGVVEIYVLTVFEEAVNEIKLGVLFFLGEL